MAFLYQSGTGVSGDEMHACSLFANAAESDNPFQPIAARLARQIQEIYPPGHCPSTWGAQRPATFVLGPNYRLTLSHTRTTVSLDGHERSVPAPEGSALAVYAPAVYTPLDVTRPVATRRHFVQTFVWWPTEPVQRSSWVLVWTLSEVSGLDVVELATEPDVLTVTATSPESVDLSHLATIRVNAGGEAEWSIGSGPDARHGVIPWWQTR